jgi:capsular polysaccharide biosynthesis protein
MKYHRVSCFFQRIYRFTLLCYRRCLTYIFRPTCVSLCIHGRIPLSSLHESLGLKIVNIKKGRIYTDGTCNIAVISNRRMLPDVSWQYEYGKVLSDWQNHSLTQPAHFKSFPARYRAIVVSLLTGGSGCYNYYHWLFDVLSRYFLAKDYLDAGFMPVKYLVPSLTHPFQSQSLLHLGITPSQCIDSTSCNHLAASRLIVTSHPNPEPHDHQGWIVDRLRNAFLPHSDDAASDSSGGCIYISRSDAAHHRNLVNEPELLKALEPFGLQCYTLSRLSLQQQIRLFANAQIIIAVHGAGLANLSFASKGAMVFELFSDIYQPSMYERIAQHNALDYTKVVCDAASSADPRTTNISISSHGIKLIAERLASRSS